MLTPGEHPFACGCPPANRFNDTPPLGKAEEVRFCRLPAYITRLKTGQAIVIYRQVQVTLHKTLLRTSYVPFPPHMSSIQGPLPFSHFFHSSLSH